MAAERSAHQALLILLAGLWLKVAADVLFDFGPESAREWFPPLAVVAVSGFALLLALLDLYVLLHPADCLPAPSVPRTSKAVIVAAFLASIFSCWAAQTTMKFAFIYLVVPAVIVILVLSPEERGSRTVRVGLLVLSFLLLFPNDTCANPQNWWWVRRIGASPLTYAAPVNVYLCLTMRSGERRGVRVVCLAAVVLYYAASVYHRMTDGY